MTQDAARITARVLAAVESPFVDVIGHPTGRLIDRRAGLPVDFAPVFKAAAANALPSGVGKGDLTLSNTAIGGVDVAGVFDLGG